MMKLFVFLFMMIPLVLLNQWWLFIFFIMLGVFFMNFFWFFNFYCMISYGVGGDLFSFSMVFLTLWIIGLMLLASYLIYVKEGMYFMLVIFFLLVFLIFSFVTVDLFMFYLFFESSLIPTFILIFGWGYQPERLNAGYYLLFYTLFASLPLLILIFLIKSCSGTLFFFLIDYYINYFLVYFFLILAFLVKMPMIFFHFWLPSAHVEAPISGSMILAGILLKLGGYGLIRLFSFMYFSCYFFNYIIIGISLYGCFIVGILCLFQVDIKSLIAYSSVSHMGLVLCGIFTLNFWGLTGCLIMMIGHGLCSSGLFCLANIIYDRVKSRSLLVNKGLIAFTPSLSLFFFILISNNMASPISLNLMGEIMLINSLMSWCWLCFLFLALSSFLSCCYSIYLFSSIFHGEYYMGLSIWGMVNFREYLLIFYHLFPLNIIFLKVDIFVIWL